MIVSTINAWHHLVSQSHNELLTISMLLTGKKIFMVNDLKSISEVDIKYTTALFF